jgi:hypothetical protein
VFHAAGELLAVEEDCVWGAQFALVAGQQELVLRELCVRYLASVHWSIGKDWLATYHEHLKPI